MKTCSVEGCERKHYATVLCTAHYQRKKRHGTAGTVADLYRVRGSGNINSHGYHVIRQAGQNRPVHVLLAEKALGHPLPPEAEVHHADGNTLNNARDNLVICPDRAYHKLLHLRMRALDACGHADWRKCTYCKEYDTPRGLHFPASGRGPIYHQACRAKYDKERRSRAAS